MVTQWTQPLFGKDAMLVKFFLNRALKVVGMIFCLISSPLLISAIWKFILPGVFHKNLKILLIFYFGNALVQSIIHPIIMIVMLYHTFSDEPCDVYLPRYFLIIGQITSFYVLLTQIHLQVALCIERVIATLSSSSYERRSSHIGVAFTLIAISSPVFIGYWMYHDEDFHEPSPSVFVASNSLAFKTNVLFVYGIALCLLPMILVQFLKWHNKRKIKETIGQITVRFQINENIQTTSFIIVILSLQFSVFLFAGCGLFILRLTAGFFDPYDLTYRTLKTSLYLVPVFLLLLPILTKQELQRGKTKRKKLSLEHVSIKTTGEEGIENYNRIIYTQW